jgi:phosphatidylserine/phosphatidylglycerophosphate/cardiolipin synthase-like enzyme
MMQVSLSLIALAISTASFAKTTSSEIFYENSSGTPLLTLLSNAHTSIDIEIYEMDDPLVMTAIKAASDRGVHLRIVKEDKPVGASCRVFEAKSAKDSASCSAQKDLVIYVQHGGGQYVPFKTATLCAVAGSTCYEHGKIVIVDGNQTLISTGNFNTSNLCNKKEHPDACNRDYSVVSSDLSVISTVSQFFNNDLVGSTYNVSDILNHVPTQKVTVSPLSLKPLLAFIASAQTKIQVQNQYLKDTDINQALMDAVKRGVQVEIMVASACSFGKPTAGEIKAWNKIYTAFDAAGVKSRIFTRNIQVNGVAGYLHAKAIVVDGVHAWVGSVNGSVTSITNNREYGVFLDDVPEVSKLKVFMDQDFASPYGESWQDSAACAHDPAPSPQAPTELHS